MITSRHNSWFKRLREAIDDHDDEIVIEGPKMIRDALLLGWRPVAVITRGETTDHDPIFEDHLLPFEESLFDNLRETRTSQGLMGLFARPELDPDLLTAREDSVVVALDGVQDPGNVGTIIRLAAAFDAAAVALLPGCADPFGPKTIRASAGAVLAVPLVHVTEEELSAIGWPMFAADSSGEKGMVPTSRAILIFGNEGAGVSPTLLSRSTPVAIPTSGLVESLNVAASAAILLSRSFDGR